ncbi:MAG TPA: GDP-mannose 4,6-dehydratase [Candidatus Woesebacteria bacterium]|nr:GDP-mannose 4,6-dehydratase [Candidatus Woesebacteria bacterium]
MKNQVVLVTGGSGFVGSHLLELLQINLDLELHATTYGRVDTELQNLLPRVKFHHLDLTQFEPTVELIKTLSPNQIYHLASFAAVGSSFTHAPKIMVNNISLQLSLLEAVRVGSPKAKILIISSAEVYGLSQVDEIPISEAHPYRPLNPYAVSKLSQDMLAYAYGQSYHIPIVRVRPFNHIGERQTEGFVVPEFAKQIAEIEVGKRAELLVGNLDAVRDFSDVLDVVRAYQLMMTKGQAGEVYNLGSGIGTTIAVILDMLVKQAKVKIQVKVDPERLRPSDLPVMIADATKLRALGWQPSIPLETTLNRVLDYWRKIV